MSEIRLKLGETLIEAGVITRETLEKALLLQKKRQLRLGTILLQEGFVTESQLVQALSLKLSIPWVSIWRVDIPDEIIDLVPCNIAEEFFVIPIYIRVSNKSERALYVAMNDPTDENALKFVAAAAGMPVKPMIAGPSDIAESIRTYYYDEEFDTDSPESIPPTATPETSTKPPVTPRGTPPVVSTPPKMVATKKNNMTLPPLVPKDKKDRGPSLPPLIPAPISSKFESTPPPSPKTSKPPKPAKIDPANQEQDPSPAPQEKPVIDKPVEPHKKFPTKQAAQREAERRIYGVGGNKPNTGFALTLLDGTTLSFGAPKKVNSSNVETSPQQISKEDLLAGLAAAAAGTPIEDFLPSTKWESYIAAMLKVLLNKHLIFYDEFLKELNEIEKNSSN